MKNEKDWRVGQLTIAHLSKHNQLVGDPHQQPLHLLLELAHLIEQAGQALRACWCWWCWWGSWRRHRLLNLVDRIEELMPRHPF